MRHRSGPTGLAKRQNGFFFNQVRMVYELVDQRLFRAYTFKLG